MSQPSLRALKAFAETSRSGSLAAASRVLNVTPSAVSHLLHELERSLAMTLFVTRGPRARLTDAGEKLGRRLATAFDTIDAAIAEAHHRAGDVRVSALSSFLTLWLVPRLTGFQSRHPDTRLLLSTGMRPVDLENEPYECAIRWGRGGWSGLEATRLFHDRPVVVTNPRLLRSDPRDCPASPPAPAPTTGRWSPPPWEAGRPAGPDLRNPRPRRAGRHRRHGSSRGRPQPRRQHDRQRNAGRNRPRPAGPHPGGPLVRRPPRPPAHPPGAAVPRLAGQRSGLRHWSVRRHRPGATSPPAASPRTSRGRTGNATPS